MRLGDWLYYRTAHGGHTQRTLGRRRACAASVTHLAELTISIKLKVVKPKSEHVKSVLSLLQHTTESEKLKNLRGEMRRDAVLGWTREQCKCYPWCYLSRQNDDWCVAWTWWSRPHSHRDRHTERSVRRVPHTSTRYMYTRVVSSQRDRQRHLSRQGCRRGLIVRGVVSQ
jgi:hypothetical protein